MASGASKGAKKIKPFDEQDTKLASGKLGTLHWADKVGNTPAWQNRMGVDKKGKRLYDFGEDLIRKI